METTQPQLKKDKQGIRLLWNTLKNLFATKPSSPAPNTQTTPTGSTSDPSPEEIAAVTPKQPVTLFVPILLSLTPTRKLPLQVLSVLAVNGPSAIPTQEEDSALGPSADSSITGTDTQPDSEMWPARFEATFARYDSEMDASERDWRPKVPQERVYKDLRMRVRYTCHNCSTTFGRERVCVGCQHERCLRCSRYPPKRRKSRVLQDAVDSAPAQLAEDAPRPTDGGTCHECHNGFEIDIEECPNCHHKICERCLHQTSISVEPKQDTTCQPAQASVPALEPDDRTPVEASSTAMS